MHVGGKHFFLWKIGGFSLACSRKKNSAFSSLRKNCPNTKYFCFVFSPDTGKYGLKNLRIWTLFTQWFNVQALGH